MPVCPVCNKYSDSNTRYCPFCGTPVGSNSGWDEERKNPSVDKSFNYADNSKTIRNFGTMTINHYDLMKCHECGELIGKGDQANECSICHNVFCSVHFNKGKGLCIRCDKQMIESNKSKYRQEFSIRYDDGMITREERAELEYYKHSLGLDDSSVKEIEFLVKSEYDKNRTAAQLTPFLIKKINFALTSFESGNVADAFNALERIHDVAKLNSDYIRKYLIIGADARGSSFLNVIEDIPESPEKHIAKSIVFEKNKDYALAEHELDMLKEQSKLAVCIRAMLYKDVGEYSRAESVISTITPPEGDVICNVFYGRAIDGLFKTREYKLKKGTGYSIDQLIDAADQMLFVEGTTEEFKRSIYSSSKIHLENCKKAFKFYYEAALSGDPVAQNQIGFCYQYGIGENMDFSKAFEWYKKAADHNSVIALRNLGYCYMHSLGVALDKTTGFKLYLKSAELGYAHAMNSVGYSYYYGNGVGRNLTKAKEWFKRAVENGCTIAMNCYGVLLMDEGSIDKGFALIKAAADLGDTTAQYNLFRKLYRGDKVPTDDKLAFHYLKMAAEGDDVDALEAISLVYRKGYLGIPVNEELAKQYYKRYHEIVVKNEHGEIDEKKRLYENGLIHLEHNDLQKAKKSFERAAELGSIAAKQILEKIQDKDNNKDS